MSMNKEDAAGRDTTSTASAAASGIVNSVDQMVKLPLRVTGATWDLMVQGVRSMTGTGRSQRGSSNSDASSSSSSTQGGSTMMQNDQDLSGDDLKYVVWSVVFTKPGFECVLEPQHSDIVNYSADGSSFAAVKIAKFLEKARHGHVEKAESWRDHGYPAESGSAKTSPSEERGWRIPPDDQKFITFLYRVEWRLPKQEDVTRVERVTIERGTTRVA